MKILNMAESGKFSEDEIMSSLIDYDMPESYARDLIKKTLINRSPSNRVKIANK